MFSEDIGFLNLLANILMLLGVALAIYIALQLRRMVRRLETVIAPKLGIEGYLNMCASVLEAESDGKCVVNSSGQIVLVNKAMEDICGYHRSELTGKEVELLLPESVRGNHASVFRPRFMMEAAPRPMRGVELLHKRGIIRPVDIRLGYYRDSVDEYAIASVRIPAHVTEPG